MEVNDQKKNNNGVKIYNSVVEEYYDYDDNQNRKVTERKSKEGYLDKNGKAHYKESNYFINDEGKKREEEIYADDKEFVAKQQEDQDIKYFTKDKKTIDEQDFNKKKETFNTLKKENNINNNAFDAMNNFFVDSLNNSFGKTLDNLSKNNSIKDNIDNVNDFFSIFKPTLNKYRPFGLLQYDNKQKNKTTKKNSECDIESIENEVDKIQETIEKNNENTGKTKIPYTTNKLAKALLEYQSEEIEKYKRTIYNLEQQIKRLENNIKQLKNTNQILSSTNLRRKRNRTIQ